MLILEWPEVVVAVAVVSRDMVVLVEVATRVVLIPVDICRLKTLEVVVILLMGVLLGMVLVMVMEAAVQVMGVLEEEGMGIHLVRLMGILVALELGLEVVRDRHGKVKHHRVTVTTWDMEMLLLLLGVVLVLVQ